MSEATLKRAELIEALTKLMTVAEALREEADRLRERISRLKEGEDPIP
jgi:hypothetical protein